MAASALRKGDTLYNIIDFNTGEMSTYNRVTTSQAGTPIQPSDADGVLIVEREGEYFKKNYDIITLETFGVKGEGEDESLLLQKAFDAKINTRIISTKREIIIKRPVTIPKNLIIYLENTTIKAAPNFEGEYMIGIVGGNIAETLNVSLKLDANNVPDLVCLKFLGTTQITGNSYLVQVYNAAVGVWVNGNVERQNIHVFPYNCGLALKETRDEISPDNLTPDENHYRITGSGCKQWFYQSGESSSQVNFNVENTLDHDDCAVVIEGNKYVSLTGEIRGNNNGAIRIAGGTSLNVHLDIMAIIVDNGFALNVVSARSITGRLITERTTSDAVYLGAVASGSILDINLKGHQGGVGLTIGNSTGQNFQRGKITYCAYPINDDSISMRLVRANLVNIDVVATNKNIDIPTGAVLTAVTLSLPNNFITGNLAVANSSAGTPPFITFRGRYTSTELEAYTTPIAGMFAECVTNKGFQSAVYNDGWKYEFNTNGLRVPVKPVAANYSITTKDKDILVDASAGEVTIALPPVASGFSEGFAQYFTIKKVDSSTNRVRVDGVETDPIDSGQVFDLLYPNDVVTVFSNGTNWYVANATVRPPTIGLGVPFRDLASSGGYVLTDYLIRSTGTTGNCTFTLPSAASAYTFGAGKIFVLKKADSTINTVTLAPQAGELIDGLPNIVLLAQYDSVTVQSNGTGWVVLHKNIAPGISNTGNLSRYGDYVYDVIDQYTGELVTYNKVTTYADGTAMDDAKVDGIIYRKIGTDYFLRNITELTMEMFGARGNGTSNDSVAFTSGVTMAALLKIPLVIKKTYSLNNTTVNLPENVVLDFKNVGTVMNGTVNYSPTTKIINGDDTLIRGTNVVNMSYVKSKWMHWGANQGDNITSSNRLVIDFNADYNLDPGRNFLMANGNSTLLLKGNGRTLNVISGILVLSANNVIIEDLTINLSAAAELRVYSSAITKSNVVFRRCKLTNVATNNKEFVYGLGYINATPDPNDKNFNIKFEDCTLEGIPLHLRNAGDIIMTGCESIQTINNAINQEQLHIANPLLRHAYIANNKFYANGFQSDVIDCYLGSNIHIVDNHFEGYFITTNNEATFINVKANGEQNGALPADVYRAHTTKIRGNTFKLTGFGYGIRLGNFTRNSVDPILEKYKRIDINILDNTFVFDNAANPRGCIFQVGSSFYLDISHNTVYIKNVPTTGLGYYFYSNSDSASNGDNVSNAVTFAFNKVYGDSENTNAFNFTFLNADHEMYDVKLIGNHVPIGNVYNGKARLINPIEIGNSFRTTRNMQKISDVKTATYTITLEDYLIPVDASADNRLVYLPSAASTFVNGVGQVFVIKKIDSSGNTVTIDGNGTETIDGQTTQVITTQYSSITVQSNGTEYLIVART